MALKIKPQVQSDLDEIWLTIAKDSIVRADSYLDGLYDACNMLAAHPKTGVEREYLPKDVRLLPYENYNLYYQKSGRDVHILRVRHAAMDPGRLFLE